MSITSTHSDAAEPRKYGFQRRQEWVDDLMRAIVDLLRPLLIYHQRNIERFFVLAFAPNRSARSQENNIKIFLSVQWRE